MIWFFWIYRIRNQGVENVGEKVSFKMSISANLSISGNWVGKTSTLKTFNYLYNVYSCYFKLLHLNWILFQNIGIRLVLLKVVMLTFPGFYHYSRTFQSIADSFDNKNDSENLALIIWYISMIYYFFSNAFTNFKRNAIWNIKMALKSTDNFVEYLDTSNNR